MALSTPCTGQELIDEINGKADEESMVGMVCWFAGTTAPKHYLICDGSLVSKKDYAKLYSVIGGNFGEETETHFYLPDLRGKFVRGAGSSLSNFAETQQATSISVVGDLNVNDYDSVRLTSAKNSGSSYSGSQDKEYSVRPYNITLTPIIRY